MPVAIRIEAGGVSVEAKLNDTPTARRVAEALPIDGIVNRWGEEVYFQIPVSAALEPGAKADVAVGDIGYWPTGEAFCIFFGPTPASSGPAPRAASPVNLIGRVAGDATVLSTVPEGAAVRIVRAAGP